MNYRSIDDGMTNHAKSVLIAALILLSCSLALAGEITSPGHPGLAAKAVNALGLDLLAKCTNADNDILLSPYSIQAALAMTYAGAAGDTRTEMAKVLHYPSDERELHRSFATLQDALDAVAASTAKRAELAKEQGGPSDPVTLTVANRLFGQKDYEFRTSFLDLVKTAYRAPLQPMDFHSDPAQATRIINDWVEEQTRQRIRDLIPPPPHGLDKYTELVLVNAIYLKAPWAEEFPVTATGMRPFSVRGRDMQDVPTMVREGSLGYARRDGFGVVAVPYSGGDVQFLILLPDKTNGLAELEAKLTPELLASCAKSGNADVILYLPKFKMEPPALRLSGVLRSLGMKSAFNPSTANFDRMAPRRQPPNNLFILEVFHKTFLALDERGTEAEAATAVVMEGFAGLSMTSRPKPVEVRVDHPFLFAIQHRPSGACLFLGRVTDPR